MITPAIHLETREPWTLGRLYSEFLELGYREIEIAEKVGRSQSTISRYVHIFRGLHPKIVELLESLYRYPNILALGRVARLRDRDDEPDFERQRKLLAKIMGSRVLRRR